MSLEDQLKEAVLLGQEVEDFVHGKAGQKLLEIVRMEVDAAALEMREVDLKDDRKLRDIQNRIWRATQFEAWLEEILIKGKEAFQQLKGEYEPQNR